MPYMQRVSRYAFLIGLRSSGSCPRAEYLGNVTSTFRTLESFERTKVGAMSSALKLGRIILSARLAFVAKRADQINRPNFNFTRRKAENAPSVRLKNACTSCPSCRGHGYSNAREKKSNHVRGRATAVHKRKARPCYHPYLR